MKIMRFAPLALIATMPLAACGEEPAPAEEASAELTGLEVSNARLVLPAVAGNPAAAYFDLAYSGDDTAILMGASVAGAESAVFHNSFTNDVGSFMEEMGPVTLENGKTYEYKQGENHLMVMGLPDTVEEGDTVDISFDISPSGQTFTFPAQVVAPGSES